MLLSDTELGALSLSLAIALRSVLVNAQQQ